MNTVLMGVGVLMGGHEGADAQLNTVHVDLI
jgi:hypothetical protein